ncbi:MAG: hypothetical protein OSA48_08655 [Akkermansiaceae bacterium]|nr:hypothetical protein [Akkermansiaceae bacterium]
MTMCIHNLTRGMGERNLFIGDAGLPRVGVAAELWIVVVVGKVGAQAVDEGADLLFCSEFAAGLDGSACRSDADGG